MLKLDQDGLENDLLKKCCKENGVDIEGIKKMMETEEEYATKSRRYGIIEKLKDIVESSF